MAFLMVQGVGVKKHLIGKAYTVGEKWHVKWNNKTTMVLDFQTFNVYCKVLSNQKVAHILYGK